MRSKILLGQVVLVSGDSETIKLRLYLPQYIFLFLLLITLACHREQKAHKAERVMGCMVEIKAFSADVAECQEAVDDAFEQMRLVDKLMSTYKPESEISQLNQLAGLEPLKVSPQVMEIIRESKRYSELTDGAFDVTVGPLVELWGFKHKNWQFPADSEIQRILPLVNYKNILLDEETQTVKLKLAGMKIGFGAIGKGYAVDKAIGVLKGHGIKRALVNASGSIFALGTKSDKTKWTVGIRHPRGNRQNIFATLQIENQGMATSGDYENFFVKDGKRYSHLLNPRTGKPVDNGMLSVTIVSQTATEADALSTSIFVLGVDRGLRLIEELDGVEGVLIRAKDADSTELDVIISSGLKDKINFVKARESN